MKKLIFVTLLMMVGCASTNTPNLNLSLVNMSYPASVMIHPLKPHEKDNYKNEWVDFEFELKEGRSNSLHPVNIVLLSSSNENSDFIDKAERALKRWIYLGRLFPNYKLHRYAIRIVSHEGQKFEGFQCHSISCIKI